MDKRIPVVEEELQVDRRVVETGRVRVAKRIHEDTVDVELPSEHEDVEVRRVAVNRPVDAPVATRQDGDTLIVPVHEEVTVLTRQLVLAEEIHITRRRRTTQATQRVTLRREQVSVEREPAPDSTAGAHAPAPGQPPE